jgi:hypothetical protein
MDLVERDRAGVLHVVALSGGHDSTAMAFLLKEQNPDIPYIYVCTPTGNELPAMFEHWRNLGARLGRRLLPIVAEHALHGTIRREKMLPNFRARFCTRILKIEPYYRFLRTEAANGPVVSYVGLRADEEGRAGGVYSDIDNVTMRFPLRELGYAETDVQAALQRFDIVCPNRTDCGECYHQRLGEWYEYWRDHPDLAARAAALEDEIGGTFRSPGRDSWPLALRDLFSRFAAGDIPTTSLARMQRERMMTGSCRVCSL